MHRQVLASKRGDEIVHFVQLVPLLRLLPDVCIPLL
jgi:hypothetical protein